MTFLTMRQTKNLVKKAKVYQWRTPKLLDRLNYEFKVKQRKDKELGYVPWLAAFRG